MQKKLYATVLALASIISAAAQDTCYSRLEGDTLAMGNTLVERKFVWNGGNLMTYSLTDKQTGKTHLQASLGPDFIATQDASRAGTDPIFAVGNVEATSIHPAYLRAVVGYTMDALQIRREYRIYDDCAVIACDTYLRGSMTGVAAAGNVNNADLKNIEFVADMKSKPVTMTLEKMHFSGMHWHAKAVEFWDITDWNNNLVTERDIIGYRKNNYTGNLLFMRDGVDGNGVFFLKEAPCSSVQLAWRGSDFTADFGKFVITSPGVSERDITPDSWTRAYSCVTGVFGGTELDALQVLRSYQKRVRTVQPDRDEMIMMNTWGDRSQDAKVNEAFCLSELDKAARLGITLFQIDDGWQVGKSPNSAVAKGSFTNIWDNPDYWTPDPEKYPRGLTSVVEKGAKLGIKIGLWFNPSVQNDFEDWEKDATTLIGLYKKYGIKMFKIDGLTIPTKKAEINLRRLFDAVLAASDNEVVFNLDATASRRGGYHMFNEYGNIFLENRYTDWQNYYPYWTLRNLWQLSKYVPAEKLQIEFLNKWRNADKYGDDPFAPAAYSLEYLFAITMAGQPLAWMEASNLPEAAFGLKKLTDSYLKIQHDFHNGTILPVGDEPSGRSWTGFQSVAGKKSGYILIFREDNARTGATVETWLPEGAKVTLTALFGDGKSFKATVGENGTVKFSLPRKNSFAMYKYAL